MMEFKMHAFKNRNKNSANTGKNNTIKKYLCKHFVSLPGTNFNKVLWVNSNKNG